ncbi:four helix bundle protein [Capnocytophaga canis]|uniref:four helix bundle protein n=1 Tax=Capnocytophaga canis TaxID=1848903 RepID=UPI00370D73ED
MRKDNIIQEKTFAFAVRIVNVYRYMVSEHNERVLSKQLLRCGTSIGANVEEAIGAQSDKDFWKCCKKYDTFNKMDISVRLSVVEAL